VYGNALDNELLWDDTLNLDDFGGELEDPKYTKGYFRPIEELDIERIAGRSGVTPEVYTEFYQKHKELHDQFDLANREYDVASIQARQELGEGTEELAAWEAANPEPQVGQFVSDFYQLAGEYGINPIVEDDNKIYYLDPGDGGFTSDQLAQFYANEGFEAMPRDPFGLNPGQFIRDNRTESAGFGDYLKAALPAIVSAFAGPWAALGVKAVLNGGDLAVEDVVGAVVMNYLPDISGAALSNINEWAGVDPTAFAETMKAADEIGQAQSVLDTLIDVGAAVVPSIPGVLGEIKAQSEQAYEDIAWQLPDVGGDIGQVQIQIPDYGSIVEAGGGGGGGGGGADAEEPTEEPAEEGGAGQPAGGGEIGETTSPTDPIWGQMEDARNEPEGGGTTDEMIDPVAEGEWVYNGSGEFENSNTGEVFVDAGYRTFGDGETEVGGRYDMPELILPTSTSPEDPTWTDPNQEIFTESRIENEGYTDEERDYARSVWDEMVESGDDPSQWAGGENDWNRENWILGGWRNRGELQDAMAEAGVGTGGGTGGGDGTGDGTGSGSGDGSGTGSGSGAGNGSGDGDGSGEGSGPDLGQQGGMLSSASPEEDPYNWRRMFADFDLDPYQKAGTEQYLSMIPTSTGTGSQVRILDPIRRSKTLGGMFNV
jgi:hypothetical protein